MWRWGREDVDKYIGLKEVGSEEVEWERPGGILKSVVSLPSRGNGAAKLLVGFLYTLAIVDGKMGGIMGGLY